LAVNEPTRSARTLSRRRFLIGGAGAAAAVGVYTVAGWIDEETYQPPTVDATARLEASQTDAPRQPIAIVVDRAATVSFGFYLGEILRAEGVNTFEFVGLDGVTADALAGYRLILLPPARLTLSQAAGLSGYAERGGALIALQPDPAIAALFGVQPADGTTTGGYLQPAGESPPLQIHAAAAHYALDGAAMTAELYRDRSTATGFPAVTVYESSRGRTAMFAYDLAYNIALTRQGNPAAANQERDNTDGIRAKEMFVDWLDLDNIAVPQADAQAHLLIDLIESMLRDRMPLPRLWTFPGQARSAIVLTGDAHAAGAPFIEDTLKTAEAFGGHATVYYSPPADDGIANGLRRSLARLPLLGWIAPGRDGRPTPETVNDWRARGHEFGVHPYVEDGVDSGYVRFLRAFRRDQYAPASPTVRTHRVLWNGWVETARVQAGRGFRMNVDYYHIGPPFQADDGSWPAGHFIGSGLPMKFVDEQGRIINIYQQPTQLADEHWLATTNRGWAGMDGEQATRVARGLIDGCLAGAHAALCVQYHMDFTSADQPDYQNAHRWLTGILGYARRRGLPILSAERWLAFVEARHDAAVTDLRWDDSSSTLSFAMEIRPVAEPMTVLLPSQFGERRLSEVRMDGRVVTGRADRVGEREYIWVAAEAQSHAFTARYAMG
jgi:hypothetical protein